MRAEEAHLAHLGHDRAIEGLVTEGRDNARQEPVAGVGPGRVADHAFVVGQAAVEIKGVIPAEGLGRVRGAVVGHGLVSLRGYGPVAAAQSVNSARDTAVWNKSLAAGDTPSDVGNLQATVCRSSS